MAMIEPVAGLDGASRVALAGFVRRLVLPGSLMVWPCLTGAWSVAGMMGVLSLWLSASAVVGACVASWRREAMGAGSLNHWDEMLAFLALARLAHLGAGVT